MMNADEMTGYPSIDKPWLKYYSKEFINKPLKKCTVYQNVYTSNSEHMSDIALIYFNNKISYRTLFREVDRCAYSLKCMGIQSGDIISLCTAGTPESIYLLLAANKLGAVCNFVNPFFTEEQLLSRINETHSKVLFVLDSFYKQIQPVINKLNIGKIIIIPALNSASILIRSLNKLKNNTHIKYSDKLVSWQSFVDKKVKVEPTTVADYVPNHDAIMVYSSGSTGASKGIVLTNDGINATIQNYDYGYDYLRGDIFLQMVPVWFSTGIVLSTIMPLQKGVTVILEPRFNVEAFISILRKYHVALTLVPTSIWVSFITYHLAHNLDLSAMKYPITGGEQILSDTEDEINAFLKARGCQYPLLKGYGMCELGSTLTATSRLHSKKNSVGYPILGKAIVSAFDIETNSELKYCERGEIRAITPAHMKGYFNNEEATSEFFKEDSKGQIWACTGDIGYVDEEGYLFILGRSTDSYKSDNGRVIYLFDAERVILKDKNISLCKVIDTTYKSKKVSAAHIILKRDENVNEVIKRLYLNCTESLPADEVPQLWKIRKTMPVHKSGKRDVEALKNECSGYYDSEGNIIENIR